MKEILAEWYHRFRRSLDKLPNHYSDELNILKGAIVTQILNAMTQADFEKVLVLLSILAIVKMLGFRGRSRSKHSECFLTKEPLIVLSSKRKLEVAYRNLMNI